MKTNLPPKVLRYMSSPVIAASPTDNLAHIRNLMLRHDISTVVIIDERERPVGVVSRKELLRVAVAKNWFSRPIDRILASEVMIKPYTIKPSVSIKKAANIMLKKDLWSLIVTEEDKLVGIITRTDLARAYAEKYYGKAKVKEYMEVNVPTVTPTHTAYYVAELLYRTNLRRVIVVDEGKPVGIITESDLAFAEGLISRGKAETFRKRPGKSPRGKYAMVRYYLVPLASDIMTSNLITIESESDLAEAADAMIVNGISGLPVVDNGKLLGLVSKANILKAITEVS